MSDENKVFDEELDALEIPEADQKSIDGGAAYYGQHKIVTAITSKCGNYERGDNFYNKKIMALSGTCARCKHFTTKDGWQICGLES